MQTPNVFDIASELKDIAQSLEVPEDTDDAYATDGSWCDVRLQVLASGSYAIHVGDACYDTDHRGYWGASSIAYGDSAPDIFSTAQRLVDDALEGILDEA